MATLTLLDQPPLPSRADFGFEINFQCGVGPASRVFTATQDFIISSVTLYECLTLK